MLDIGGWEFLVVAFVLLMVVGPKELPKMLRGFTRAMRQIRSMASEFTRGMEDLASESELGELKNTIADVKSGNLDNIADKIDFGAELKESVADLKSETKLDETAKELSDIKISGVMLVSRCHLPAPLLRQSQKQPKPNPRKRKRARTHGRPASRKF